MLEATTTEFTKNFGRYREAVQREPVAVMNQWPRNGLSGLGCRIRAAATVQAACCSAPSPPPICAAQEIEAIATGRMESAHHHLDALLDPT